jgi:hypothetical protein
MASQAGEILPDIRAIRGCRSKHFSLFLKRSRFFSFVRGRTHNPILNKRNKDKNDNTTPKKFD